MTTWSHKKSGGQNSLKSVSYWNISRKTRRIRVIDKCSVVERVSVDQSLWDLDPELQKLKPELQFVCVCLDTHRSVGLKMGKKQKQNNVFLQFIPETGTGCRWSCFLVWMPLIKRVYWWWEPEETLGQTIGAAPTGFWSQRGKKNKNKKTGNGKKEPEMRKTNNGENQMKQQEGDRMRR